MNHFLQKKNHKKKRKSQKILFKKRGFKEKSSSKKKLKGVKEISQHIKKLFFFLTHFC